MMIFALIQAQGRTNFDIIVIAVAVYSDTFTITFAVNKTNKTKNATTEKHTKHLTRILKMKMGN